MRLTYWYSKSKDARFPDLRSKTRAELLSKIKEKSGSSALPSNGNEFYEKPKKVVVEYRDGFHLLEMCLSDERPFWVIVF